MNVVKQIGDALVVYCAAIGVASVFVHAGVRPRWWTNLWGTHLMVYMAALSGTFVVAAVRIVVGASLDTPWYAVLRMVVFVLVPVAMTQRLAIQVGLRWHIAWPWHRSRTSAQETEHDAEQAANRRPPTYRRESGSQPVSAVQPEPSKPPQPPSGPSGVSPSPDGRR